MSLRIRKSTSSPVRVIEIGVAHLAAGRIGRSASGSLEVDATWRQTWTGVEGEPGPALDEALADLRAEWGEGGPVHVVIPGHHVLTKCLRVPATAEAQRDRIVAFEARQAIPFPLEEVVWDHALLDDSGKELSVLLAAAKADGVLGLLQRVRAHGFEPVRVVPASVALLTAWQQQAAAAGPAMVLSLGARSTQMLLVDDDSWQLRTLALGGNMVSRALAERLEQSTAEADRLKQQVLGAKVDLPTESPVAQAVRAATKAYEQRLLVEVARSLMLRRQDDGWEPAGVWVTGGAAATPGLVEALRKRLGKPTATWTADSLMPAEWWGGAHAAMGEGMAISLLPESLAAAAMARRRRPRWFAVAALVVVALVLPGVHFRRLAHARLAAAAGMQRLVAPHQVLQAQINDDVLAVEALMQQHQELAKLVEARGAWSRLLSDLGERIATVDDTWFERLQVLPPSDGETTTRLRISGRMLDRENPLARVSPASYERATALLAGLVESPFVNALEGERFDAAQPGIPRFDFTLQLNPAMPL